MATAILVAACGGGGGEPQPNEFVAKTAGDQQQGIVGEQLANPLSVTVTLDGAPAPGIAVNWSTPASGGSVTPTSAETDANGVASTTWTLGTTSGAQTATASVSGAAGSPATFSATAAAAAPAALEGTAGNNQTGEINTALAQPVVAIATDEFGNGVAGVDVTWAATGATLSVPTAVTDASGVSSVIVTLGGTAGPITITAASDGLEGSPVTFTATATEPASIPTSVAVTVLDFDFVSVRNGTTGPAVDTVAVGGSVTWTWAASVGGSHNITPAGPPSFTGRGTVPADPPPAPYTVNFAAPGTYNYYCSLHGSATSGMSGRIVVR